MKKIMNLPFKTLRFIQYNNYIRNTRPEGERNMVKRSNTTSIPYAAKKKTFWQLLWKQKALCIMALAPLIMLIIFKYVPMYGILIAFKNYKSIKRCLGTSNWLEPVLKNFIKFFKNVNSGQIIWNTLKIWSSEFVIYVSGGNYLCYSAE